MNRTTFYVGNGQQHRVVVEGDVDPTAAPTPIPSLISSDNQDTTEQNILNTSSRDYAVLFTGKSGAGKTTTARCLAGHNQAVWAFENILSRATFTFGQGSITINDAQGFRGNLKYDWPLLRQTISKLHSEQPIDMVILCLSFVRFNQEDENILYLLREFTTPAFHRLIRVVITHAPEGVVNEESKAMIAEKLSFLGNSPEEILAEKVTFVDLISPLSFPSHLVETVRQRWTVAKERLTQQLLATNPEESIKPNEIMAKSYLHQFYLVYKREIFIAITIMINLFLLYFIVFNRLWTLEEEAQSNMCMNDLDTLANKDSILLGQHLKSDL